MKRKVGILALIGLAIVSLGACAKEIKPDSPDSGVYSTQTSMSAIEYSTYMSKQISVYSNQLTTLMTAAVSSADSVYENRIAMAEESLDIMQETVDEVIVTMPSTGKESERESAITAMNTAIEHTENYINQLQQGKDVSDYASIFHNDFNAITGLSNLYNE